MGGTISRHILKEVNESAEEGNSYIYASSFGTSYLIVPEWYAKKMRWIK